MKNIVLIGIGGFLGAICRYFIIILINSQNRYSFPFGTFTINILGSLFLGFIIMFLINKPILISFKDFLIIGVLGSFTTFSAFSYEMYEMLVNGNYKLSMLYSLSSIVFSLICISCGMFIAKQLS